MVASLRHTTMLGKDLIAAWEPSRLPSRCQVVGHNRPSPGETAVSSGRARIAHDAHEREFRGTMVVTALAFQGVAGISPRQGAGGRTVAVHDRDHASAADWSPPSWDEVVR